MTYNHESHWTSYSLRKSFDAFAQDLLNALEKKRRLPEVPLSDCYTGFILMVPNAGTRTGNSFHRA